MDLVIHVYHCRQNGMFFRQGGGGELVVNSDDMTTDQKHCSIIVLILENAKLSHLGFNPHEVLFAQFQSKRMPT